MIACRDVERVFHSGRSSFAALRNVSFEVAAGEWVAMIGPSGSGKSTLLNLIAGLDRPSGGDIVVAGHNLTRMSEEALAAWRARHVGIVFQFFQLLPTLTAGENVILPMEFAALRADRSQRARRLLASVGVESLVDRLPGEMSGGEQQRVAIARALANDPVLLIADEPTGNLDAANGAAVLDLLIAFWRDGGTLVLVTHDRELAARAPRVLQLADGTVRADRSSRPLPARPTVTRR